MPTAAISAFGVQLRIGNGTPLTPLTITDATNATPIVIATSGAHGIVDVSHGTVAGVVGNTAANGTWIVSRVDATHLTLRTSVGNGAYVSGGTLTLDSTYTPVAEITKIDDLGATAQTVDVTAHDAASAWSSKISTFLDVGNMRVSLNFVPTHATHDATTGLYKLLHDRIRRPLMVVLPDAGKKTWFMTGIVTGWDGSHPVNGALTAQVSILSAGDLVLA